MAQRKGVLMPIIALVLGVIAVALSFLAYSQRIKAEDVGSKKNGVCVYPSSRAYALGMVAAMFLLGEQIIISVATNCFCCCGPRFPSTCTAITSIILFVCSWITFVIAYIGLIYTAMHNKSSYLAKAYSGNNGNFCKLEKDNLFLGAAIWCIITIILGLISYAFWMCGASNKNNNYQSRYGNSEQGIAMGQPHTQLAKEQY
ncbi:hypothetical protein BVRB_3g051720 [Beta vulgaris subsp. vulgaris]|uniref:uncharacterized protein LOC104888225 n=1 Tax=Beta vulgaris subsp. vulgaris TaxID=3555 RepID=UPI00053F45D9|nr:uncharacterized protein LOC104888225 [Beta vulgaris subsp. vulgaris]KMT15989.1 hypothetical protein BVRB_3g051720 [Beta vulgaris subsp. vulgaris]